MIACRICGGAVDELLDFGPQPICNRFLPSADAPEARWPMAVGVCEACALVQLTMTAPGAELIPRVDWITYKEAEGHLDTLARDLAVLPGIGPSSVIAGLTFKEDTLLQRLTARGFRTWRIDPQTDLGADRPGGGVETVQHLLTPAAAERIAAARGPADIVVARHILEHAHDLPGFFAALKRLLRPGGYLVLEVPNCTRAITLGDYTTLWEEHTCYFTPATFRMACAAQGLAIRRFDEIPSGMLENPLLAIARWDGRPAASGQSDVLAQEDHRAREFARRLQADQRRLPRWAAEFRRREGQIVVFGAGHLSCVYLNLFDLAPHVGWCVDDHPKKQGSFMPGSRLPIRPSSTLNDPSVRLCLLGLSPESEEGLIARNQAFVARGGRFASILRASSRALDLDADAVEARS